MAAPLLPRRLASVEAEQEKGGPWPTLRCRRAFDPGSRPPVATDLMAWGTTMMGRFLHSTRMTTPLNIALMQLSRRAESVDRAVLVSTFVSAGPLFHVLRSTDHQILYGR